MVSELAESASAIGAYRAVRGTAAELSEVVVPEVSMEPARVRAVVAALPAWEVVAVVAAAAVLVVVAAAVVVVVAAVADEGGSKS